MATLTTKARKAIPASKFALSDGRFPVENKAHAVAAKRLVGRSLSKGNITPPEAAKVRHRADVVLGENDSNYHNK
jgi:hypothetical protein